MKVSRNISPLLLCDFYKISHVKQYPAGTEKIYETMTARKSRIEGIDKVVFFGLQRFVKEYLIEYFNDNFFSLPIEQVIADYTRYVGSPLGDENPDYTHIAALHKLGYLPIRIAAVPEGTLVPIRTPFLTVESTHPDFAWLPGSLETLTQSELWHSITSATIAHEYKRILAKFSTLTCDTNDHLAFQAHDFSLRGLTSVMDGMNSGMGHLLSFSGTDTIPAIFAAEKYYAANLDEELIAASIPATEHTIQECFENNDEEYLISMLKLYPKGIFSIVCDGYDFFKMLTLIIPNHRDEILARDGKMVVRPDSGDIVKIICGDPGSSDVFIRAGAIECLWHIFGGTVNSKGYKVLDPHISLVYGDSVTLDIAKTVLLRLKENGFASSNVTLGVGSFTYQYVTRDTFSFAEKTTFGIFGGIPKALYKDPKTDDGTKKSQKGRVFVAANDEGRITYWKDGFTEEPEGNFLQTVFENGYLKRVQTFEEVRAVLANQ